MDVGFFLFGWCGVWWGIFEFIFCKVPVFDHFAPNVAIVALKSDSAFFGGGGRVGFLPFLGQIRDLGSLGNQGHASFDESGPLLCRHSSVDRAFHRPSEKSGGFA